MVVAFASWCSGGLVRKRIKTGLRNCCAHALSSLFIVLFLIVSCCRKNAKYQSCRNDTNLEKINNIHCAFVSLQECRIRGRGQRHSEFFSANFVSRRYVIRILFSWLRSTATIILWNAVCFHVPIESSNPQCRFVFVLFSLHDLHCISSQKPRPF